MKKILMGLLAISSLAFAVEGNSGEFDITKVPAGAPTFTIDGDASIQIQGTLTTDVEVVKYVVFAMQQGKPNSTSLNFGDFMLMPKGGEGSKTGFQETTLPFIAIKRMNGTDGYAELADNEKVATYYETSYAELNNWVKTGSIIRYIPTQLLSKDSLDSLITKLSTKPATKDLGTYENINGCIVLTTADGKKHVYTPASVFAVNNGMDSSSGIESISFKAWEAGALDVQRYVTGGLVMNAATGALVQSVFDGGVAVNGVMKVKVVTE